MLWDQLGITYLMIIAMNDFLFIVFFFLLNAKSCWPDRTPHTTIAVRYGIRIECGNVGGSTSIYLHATLWLRFTQKILFHFERKNIILSFVRELCPLKIHSCIIEFSVVVLVDDYFLCFDRRFNSNLSGWGGKGDGNARRHIVETHLEWARLLDDIPVFVMASVCKT